MHSAYQLPTQHAPGHYKNLVTLSWVCCHGTHASEADSMTHRLFEHSFVT